MWLTIGVRAAAARFGSQGAVKDGQGFKVIERVQDSGSAEKSK